MSTYDIQKPLSTTELDIPFEASLLEQLREDSQYGRVPIIRVLATDYKGNKVDYSGATYPQIWSANYALSHQGEVIDTNTIKEAGFPTKEGVKDALSNIVKMLKRLSQSGFDIQPLEGRTYRKYRLPLFNEVKVVYLGNRHEELASRREKYTTNTDFSSDFERLNETYDHYFEEPLYKPIPFVSLEWRDEAACIGFSKYFTSDKKNDIERAKQKCATCRVTKECANYQKLTHSTGVWAGVYFE